MQSLDPAQRSVILRLASVIFPGTPRMPSAMDVALSQDLLDDALRARPDLVSPLLGILDTVGGEAPSNFVNRLAADEPERFSILMQVVAGAYFLDRRVRAAVAYSGQTAVPFPYTAAASAAFAQHTARDRIRYRSA
jgi:hypothetical protein